MLCLHRQFDRCFAQQGSQIPLGSTCAAAVEYEGSLELHDCGQGCRPPPSSENVHLKVCKGEDHLLKRASLCVKSQLLNQNDYLFTERKYN